MDGAPANRPVWCIYVAKVAEGDFRIGKEKGIWGSERAHAFEGMEEGDEVLFLHALKSNLTPPPNAFPRVPLEEFQGTAAATVQAVVTSGPYEDRRPIWPDGSYPFRFAFSATQEDENVIFDTSTFPTEIVDAVRRSAISGGRAVAAKTGSASPEPVDRPVETWLEITIEPHGGSGWDIGDCLWSPTKNRAGAKHYEVMLEPKPGDTVFHLYETTWEDGKKEKRLCGRSVVAGKAEITEDEPPETVAWAKMGPYYRIALRDYK